MKTLMLASAILIGLGAPAAAHEVFLLCHTSKAHLDMGVDLESSTLTLYHRDCTGQGTHQGSRHYQATITPDYIQYFNGRMLVTRIYRSSGRWVIWTTAGSKLGDGSCQITDDRDRLEEDLEMPISCIKPAPR